MKPLTVAQVMGFRGAMVPPTRRAIEEYHERRAQRLAQEL